jgi:hypothetical protein
VKAHTDEKTIRRFDERGRHPLLHFLKHYMMGEHRIIPAWPAYYKKDEFETMSVRNSKTSVSALSCRTLFTDVIKKLCSSGNVVIVGRGANVILTGCRDVLSVRIIAPFEYRLERVMREKGLNHDDALKTIKRTDRQRARYIRQSYGLTFRETDRYDLLFDMGRTNEETVIQTVFQTTSALQEKERPPA